MENKKQLVESIHHRIRRAAECAGRSAEDITLIAVSKMKSVDDIVAAYEAGIRHFGENRTEELEQKSAALSDLKDLQWHFIGHLQSRQSMPIAKFAHCFHAIDRLKIANHLSRQLQDLGHPLPVFIEVNVSGEQSKGGFDCADWENNHDQRGVFLDVVKIISGLPNLPVCGLMTMAPFNAPEADTRSIFRRLRQFSEWLNTELPELDARDLSMGMSGDFEIAIEEGATHVRVGSAIFGGRG